MLERSLLRYFEDGTIVPEELVKNLKKRTLRGKLTNHHQHVVFYNGQWRAVVMPRDQYYRVLVFEENGEEVPQNLFATLVERKERGCTKRYVTTVDGNEKLVCTRKQRYDRNLFFNNGELVSQNFLDTKIEVIKGNKINRFVTVGDEKIPVFTRNQLAKRVNHWRQPEIEVKVYPEPLAKRQRFTETDVSSSSLPSKWPKVSDYSLFCIRTGDNVIRVNVDPLLEELSLSEITPKATTPSLDEIEGLIADYKFTTT